MTPRMNQGAERPTAGSAIPPTQKADDPRSLRTIATARQKEMNDNITDVATITFVRPLPI